MTLATQRQLPHFRRVLGTFIAEMSLQMMVSEVLLPKDFSQKVPASQRFQTWPDSLA
jgi:hypothetical protein